MFKKENIPTTIGLTITFLFIIPCLTCVTISLIHSL